MRFLALLALLALAACSSSGRASETTTTSRPTTTTTTTAPTTTTLPPPPVVAGLGDSLLFESTEELRAALGFGVDLRTHAVIGLTAGEGHFGLEGLLAQQPDVLVIVLGTNDALDGVIEPGELAALERVAAMASAVPCVGWVEVSTASTSPAFNDAARTWNQALHQAASRYGFEVVPWASLAAGHPEWLQADGVHHTPEGDQAFAAAVAAAVQQCPINVPD